MPVVKAIAKSRKILQIDPATTLRIIDQVADKEYIAPVDEDRIAVAWALLRFDSSVRG